MIGGHLSLLASAGVRGLFRGLCQVVCQLLGFFLGLFLGLGPRTCPVRVRGHLSSDAPAPRRSSAGRPG